MTLFTMATTADECIDLTYDTESDSEQSPASTPVITEAGGAVEQRKYSSKTPASARATAAASDDVKEVSKQPDHRQEPPDPAALPGSGPNSAGIDR